MDFGWQISAATLFEALRPAGFVVSALLSTCVLADARRRGFPTYAIILWTLAVLSLPHVVLPLYLAALILLPKRAGRAGAARNVGARRTTPVISRLAAPALYLLTALTVGAFYFYLDSTSVDGLLARASHAKLVGRRDETIRALRSALAAEDDPHTRKLLGVELAAAGRFEEALRELRAAEQGGEPDDKIHYQVAAALDALNRPHEALASYERLTRTDLCAQKYPVAECAAASARLRAAQNAAAR